MSNSNGIQTPWPAPPKPTIAPPPKAQTPPESQEGQKQPAQATPNDQSNISGDAKKQPVSSERSDLIKGLKSNYAGNGRMQTGEEKLNKLDDEQLKNVKKNRDFDKALTEHEEAHHSVAGDLARSAPLYETKTGEDGETYRTSGKVMIDTGTTDDPEKTVKKMKQVRAAALAPDGNQLAPLSEQDKKVAREAEEKGRTAQSQLDGTGKADAKDTKTGDSSF